MRVFGIDPGTAITGWGVIDLGKRGRGASVGSGSNKLYAVEYGTVITSAGLDMPVRLKDIYASLSAKIEEFSPDAVAIEDLFFFKNQKTVIKVGQARGVAILAAVNKDIPVFDYTPLQVKQAVTGYGRAEKKQMQKMVKLILDLKELPKPDDAADALAIAICHINSAKSPLS